MNAISTTSSIARWAIITTLIFLITLIVAADDAEAKLLAAAASPTSVVLNWTAPGDDGNVGQASQYDIRYAEFPINDANWNTATQPANIPTPQIAGGAESITIDGLTEGTTYYFAIKAADEVPNWSPISNVAQITTATESTPPASVINLATTGPTNASLTLTWGSPGDDSLTGTASQYDLRYSTSFINESNFASATPVAGLPSPQAPGNLESFTVDGLNSATTYYFAIKTADEVPNWSGISNVASGTTANEQDAPNDITNLFALNSTDTSVLLTWTAPGDDGAIGTASAYDIRYSTSAINNGNWNSAIQITDEPAPLVAGQSQTHWVTGLNPNTTYFFAMKTADEVPNWSGLSNIASRSTLPEQQPPANIADLASSNVTDSSITISWTAPGDDGNSGTATEYDIRYSSTLINAQTWDAAIQIGDEPTPLPAGATQTYTLSGLPQGTGYFFAIKTADEIPNWSDLSNILAVATSGDNTAPAAINDLDATPGAEQGSIDLSWTAPGDDGLFGSVSGYVIRLSLDTISDDNWESSFVFTAPPAPVASGEQQSATIPGLIAGQIYHIGIKSVDDALNQSDLSNVASAQARINIATDINDDYSSTPEEYALQQNYPNPFNPTTTIAYAVPTAGPVELSVYDISGRKTATLVDESKAAGNYATEWAGTNDAGVPVASGVYFYRIDAGSYSESKKMILVK